MLSEVDLLVESSVAALTPVDVAEDASSASEVAALVAFDAPRPPLVPVDNAVEILIESDVAALVAFEAARPPEVAVDNAVEVLVAPTATPL